MNHIQQLLPADRLDQVAVHAGLVKMLFFRSFFFGTGLERSSRSCDMKSGFSQKAVTPVFFRFPVIELGRMDASLQQATRMLSDSSAAAGNEIKLQGKKPLF